MLNKITDKNRIYGLDILRFIAIFLVIFGHASDLLPKPYNKYHESLVILDGVNLFFVLSGFLIGQILIKTYFNSEYFTFKIVLKFWIMRWMRTLPAYYFILLILCLSHLCLDNSFTLKNYLVINYFFFLQNFNKNLITFFSESWSLSIEEWFYLLTPIIIFVLNKIIKNKHFIIISTIILLISISTIYRFNTYKNLTEIIYLPKWDMDFRRIVMARLDSIAFGVLGAYLSIFYSHFWGKFKKHFLVFGILLLLLIVLLRDTDKSSFYGTVVYFHLSALGTLLTLPFLSQLKNGKGKIFSFITYTSMISYSLYLTNYSLIRELLIKDFIQNKILLKLNIGTPLIYIIEYFLYWIMLFCISNFMYKFIEVPFIKRRKSIIKKFNLN